MAFGVVLCQSYRLIPKNCGKFSRPCSMNSKARTSKMPGTNTRKSVKPLAWPAALDTSPMVNSRTPTDYVIEKPSKPASKARSHRSHGRSSTLPSSLQSKLLILGSLILTIKYICPHCSGVHFLDFPLFSSMNGKTSTRLTLRCCGNSAQKVGSLAWETNGNQFTIFGVLRLADQKR